MPSCVVAGAVFVGVTVSVFGLLVVGSPIANALFVVVTDQVGAPIPTMRLPVSSYAPSIYCVAEPLYAVSVFEPVLRVVEDGFGTTLTAYGTP